MIGTSVMVKIGQLVPFRPAYIASLTLQMIMILAMPMLAFWSPEKVSQRDMGTGSECVNMCMTRRSDGQDSTIAWIPTAVVRCERRVSCGQADGENVTPSNWGFAMALMCCAASWLKFAFLYFS